jgi:hypothetical protein
MTNFKKALAALKSVKHPAQVAGIMALGLVLLAILELYAAWYAVKSAPGGDLWPTPAGEFPRAAIIHSSISVLCGLAAFVGMAVAGSLKDDARKRFSSRAWSARVVALCFLSVPVGMLAGAFAYDRQLKAWEAYAPSEAYAADLKMVADTMADRLEREEAKRRIVPPATAERTFGDWAKAVFLHLLVMLSASAFRPAPPITAEEREAIAAAEAAAALAEKRKAAAQKGLETRKRNQAAKKAADKAAARTTNVANLFGGRRTT